MNHHTMEMAQQQLINVLRAERDEADRRAGAAERKMAHLKEQEYRRDEWLRKAKADAGFHESVSFDVVWAEALAALKEKRGEP